MKALGQNEVHRPVLDYYGGELDGLETGKVVYWAEAVPSEPAVATTCGQVALGTGLTGLGEGALYYRVCTIRGPVHG